MYRNHIFKFTYLFQMAKKPSYPICLAYLVVYISSVFTNVSLFCIWRISCIHYQIFIVICINWVKLKEDKDRHHIWHELPWLKLIFCYCFYTGEKVLEFVIVLLLKSFIFDWNEHTFGFYAFGQIWINAPVIYNGRWKISKVKLYL